MLDSRLAIRQSGRVAVDEVEFWVHDVSDAGALGTSVIGKVFRGTLRVGGVLTRVVVDDASHVLSLRIEEISMYEVAVDELDTGVSGRILVKGDGASLLRRDALLYDN